MGASSASMEFDGNAAKFMRELKRMTAGIKEQQKEMRRLADSSVRGSKAAESAVKQNVRSIRELAQQTKSLKGEFDNLGKIGRSALGGIQTILGVGGIASTISQVLASQRQFNEEIRKELALRDEVIRKLRVQTNLTDEQLQKSILPATEAVAERFGVGRTQITRVATELISRGFSEKDIGGRPGDITQNPLTALVGVGQALGEEDFFRLTKDISKAVTAAGRPLTAESILALGGQVKGAFQKEPIQPQDLSAISQAFGLIEPGRQEILSSHILAIANAGIKAGLRPREALTTTRRIGTRLQTAAENTQFMKTLKEIGAPEGFVEQLDVVGETLPQAIANFQGLIQNLPEQQKNRVVKELFGEEGILGVRNILAQLRGGGFARSFEGVSDPANVKLLTEGITRGSEGESSRQQIIKNREEQQFERIAKARSDTEAAIDLEIQRNRARLIETAGGAHFAGLEMLLSTRKAFLQSLPQHLVRRIVPQGITAEARALKEGPVFDIPDLPVEPIPELTIPRVDFGPGQRRLRQKAEFEAQVGAKEEEVRAARMTARESKLREEEIRMQADADGRRTRAERQLIAEAKRAADSNDMIADRLQLMLDQMKNRESKRSVSRNGSR